MLTALITGGSRGIGAAAVQMFAASGYQVAFTYHNSRDQAAALCAKTGAEAIYCDLSEPDSVSQAMTNAIGGLGHVDVLVNNAGIAHTGLLTDLTVAQWDYLFHVNVRSTFLCSQAVLPDMIARKSGAIVNVSSVWGITGASCEVAYSASKAAVIGLTKALAKELGPSGIRVNCVAPGVIDTDMNAQLTEQDRAVLCDQTPLERIGTPEEVAQCILFLASDRAGFITGQVLSPDGGFCI